MIRPNGLNIGDKVGIIATARKVSTEELTPCLELLNSWGLEVVFAPNLFEIKNQFAGEDAQRSEDLQWAIDHKELKAVLVARGGYGTSRMIDAIDFSALMSYPKWFIGFSDVTVLLSQLCNHGVQSIHGPIALLLAKEGHEESALRLNKMLLDNEREDIKAVPHFLNKEGVGKGQLIGGNLSILHTIISTSSDMDYGGKILFIEDLDEYLYHIDRMMVHLKRTGKLKELAGLVVGHMSDMNDNAIPFGKTAYQIIKEHTEEYTFPIGFNFPIGHETQNHPVIVGGNYELEVSGEQSTLKLF